MNSFNYEYPVRQHFGKGCAESAIKEEMKHVGQRVLLAYGGGSLKRTGLYDKIRTWLAECGKQVTDFGGIMPNPTYAKVQEGARLVRENTIEFILAVGGGSVIDCCKIVSAQARMDEDIWDAWYVHHRLPIEFIPMGAVVTASGTGAEEQRSRDHPRREEVETAVVRCLPFFCRIGQRPDEDTAHEASHQRGVRHAVALHGNLHGQAAKHEPK